MSTTTHMCICKQPFFAQNAYSEMQFKVLSLGTHEWMRLQKEEALEQMFVRKRRRNLNRKRAQKYEKKRKMSSFIKQSDQKEKLEFTLAQKAILFPRSL